MTTKRKEVRKTGSYTVNLGEERTVKVLEFKAKKLLKGTRLRNMDEVLQHVIDDGLRANGIAA